MAIILCINLALCSYMVPSPLLISLILLVRKMHCPLFKTRSRSSERWLDWPRITQLVNCLAGTSPGPLTSQVNGVLSHPILIRQSKEIKLLFKAQQIVPGTLVLDLYGPKSHAQTGGKIGGTCGMQSVPQTTDWAPEKAESNLKVRLTLAYRFPLAVMCISFNHQCSLQNPSLSMTIGA